MSIDVDVSTSFEIFDMNTEILSAWTCDDLRIESSSDSVFVSFSPSSSV